jgi:hypothetical protein
MNLRHCFIWCVSVLAVTMGNADAAVVGKFRAGAAKVDITPTESDLLYPADVIRDHIFARAIMVDNGSTCAVLMTFELSNAVDERDVTNGISRAAASTGCPAENFIVSYSHTHSSSTQGLQVGPPSSQQQEDTIVALANAAKAKLVPARIGYGTTMLDLNTSGSSTLSPEARAASKTLAVVEFIGSDNVPIGVYMNYAMHPTNFYNSGVLSGDFPGEASRYLENLFDGHAVAMFSQGASGDQSSAFDERAVSRVRNGEGLVEKFGTAAPPSVPRKLPVVSRPFMAGTPEPRPPLSPGLNMADYKRAIELTGANVTMIGALIGTSTVKVMREIQPVDTGTIAGARETFTCPGRDQDSAKPIRANGVPEYKDAQDINIHVGAVRIGDIQFAVVTGELFSEISMQLRAASPSSKTLVVTLANGRNKSGYIYSDAASNDLTMQVASSRLKPGCAQGKIVATAVKLIRQLQK